MTEEQLEERLLASAKEDVVRVAEELVDLARAGDVGLSSQFSYQLQRMGALIDQLMDVVDRMRFYAKEAKAPTET